jgi:hypothetical protein
MTGIFLSLIFFCKDTCIAPEAHSIAMDRLVNNIIGKPSVLVYCIYLERNFV